MLNTVKNVMHRFDGAGAIAKDLGDSSVDLAKTVMHRLDGAGDLAKTVGVGSLAIAKKIGVKRGLAGFAILGAAVGGILLARYLKRRASETPLYTEAEVAEEMASDTPMRRRRQSRAKRKANHAHS